MTLTFSAVFAIVIVGLLLLFAWWAIHRIAVALSPNPPAIILAVLDVLLVVLFVLYTLRRLNILPEL